MNTNDILNHQIKKLMKQEYIYKFNYKDFPVIKNEKLSLKHILPYWA